LPIAPLSPPPQTSRDEQRRNPKRHRKRLHDNPQEGSPMSDAQRSFDQGNARAARMIRAFRANDHVAWDDALAALEGNGGAVRDTLMGLAWLCNQALRLAGPDNVTDLLLNDIVKKAPATAPAAHADDAWRDAIAMAEAVARGDREGAQVLVRHTPNSAVFLGMVVQFLSLLIETCPPDVLENVVAEARRIGPPPLM
jgi:hypothetical protein